MGRICPTAGWYSDSPEAYMKYFRKHPDLILIANYPESTHRVRHARQTTSEDLSKIIVHTISTALGSTKKILLLTDATEEISRNAFITKTAWNKGNPLSIGQLIRRLFYNYQTQTICCIYHTELFGKFWTTLITPLLLLVLRLSGKRTLIVMLTTPKSPLYPTVKQTLAFWVSFLYQSLLAIVATTVIVGEKPLAKTISRRIGKQSVIVLPMTFRTLKERRTAGNIFYEELFPSPIKNLGLASMLKET